MKLKTMFFLFMIVLFNIYVLAQEASKKKYTNISTLSFEELLNVNVNAAGKKNEQIKDIPASTMVISKNEIEMYGYKNLREVIDNIPGFYVMSNLGTDVYGVRGFTKGEGNNFVILINGVEITDDLILEFYQIPIDFIDRVEIIKGPMAVMYGNSAFFGVINIITNDSMENKATVSYGSFDSKEVTFRLISENSDVKMILNVGIFDTAGIDEPLYKMISDTNRMDQPLFGGLDGRGLNLPEYARNTKNFIQKSQKTLNFTIKSKNFTFNTNYVDSENYWYYYFPSLNDGSVFNNKNLTTSLKYNKAINDNMSYLAEVRYSSSSSFNEYNHLFEEFYGTDKIDWEELDINFNFFLKPCSYADITFGFQYENMLKYVDYTNVPAANIFNEISYYIDKGDQGLILSSFIEGQFYLNRKLTLTLGVRAEKQKGYDVRILRYQGVEPPTPDYEKEIFTTRKADKTQFLPRLALVYQFDNNSVVKLLYGKSQKRPDYVTVGDDIMDIFKGEKNGKFVTPEFIETYELNFMKSFADRFALNFSVYYNTLNDLIFQRSGIIDGILRAWWENSGQMDSLGFEGTVFFNSDNGYNSELSVLSQKTDDKISKDNASFSPKVIYYLKLGKNFDNKFKFGLTAKYISQIEPFFDYTGQFDEYGNMIEYVGRSSFTVPGYLTVGASLTIENFLNPGVYASVSVTNLFDKDILCPTFSINNLWADKGTVGEGRAIQIKIGYKF